MRLLLASASPRRADLLRAAGFIFDTTTVEVDETVRSGEPAVEYVRRLATEKSARGAEQAGTVGEQHVAVLGADTVVVIDEEILGKPRDDHEAATMLRRLAGRRHEVMTAVSLRLGQRELARTEVTYVYFSNLSDTDVAWYVGTGEGRDKAGAYAIQGLASRFIPRIDGSYSNVVGLPIATVVDLLQRLTGARGIGV